MMKQLPFDWHAGLVSGNIFVQGRLDEYAIRNGGFLEISYRGHQEAGPISRDMRQRWSDSSLIVNLVADGIKQSLSVNIRSSGRGLTS